MNLIWHICFQVVNDICLLSSGGRIASCDGTIHVWNSQTGKLISAYAEPSTNSSLSKSSTVSKVNTEQTNVLNSNTLSGGILSSGGSLYTCMHHLESDDKLVVGMGNGSLRYIYFYHNMLHFVLLLMLYHFFNWSWMLNLFLVAINCHLLCEFCRLTWFLFGIWSSRAKKFMQYNISTCIIPCRFIDITHDQKLHLWKNDAAGYSFSSFVSAICSCGSEKLFAEKAAASSSWIAAGLSSGHCRLLDARSGDVIAFWRAHDGYITKVCC